MTVKRDKDDLVVGIEAIGREIGYKSETTRALLHEGKVPGAFRLGRKWLVVRSVLQAALIEHAHNRKGFPMTKPADAGHVHG